MNKKTDKILNKFVSRVNVNVLLKCKRFSLLNFEIMTV